MNSVRFGTVALVLLVTCGFGASLQAAPSYQSVLTWTDPEAFPICSLAAGDLNRDGKKDLLVGFNESVPSYVDAHISTFVQGATPRTGFTLVARQQVAWKPSVFIKDLNGDGYNDIMYTRNVTNYDYLGNPTSYAGTYSRYISLAADANIVNASSWNFAALGNFGGWISGPAFADLNQDGKMDFVRVRDKDGQVSRYFGDGTGSFPGYLDFMYFNYGSVVPGWDLEPNPIVAGHLDASNSASVNDIAIARAVDGTLFVLFQHPTGTFNGPDPNYTKRVFSCGGFGQEGAGDLHLRPTHLGIGDFNHDGKNDLIVVREDGYVYICYQGAEHDFSNVVTLMSFGKKITDMKVGDLDGNGSDDFVIARSNGDLYVNLQTAPGVFNTQLIASFPSTDPNVGLIGAVDIADMDNDGLNDIVVGLTDGRIFIFYQQPSCSQKIPGDVTGDCMVDYRDVNLLASQWLLTTSGAPYAASDTNGDNTVNLKDMAVIANHWMQCNLINQGDCWK
jgi:hypothetical protein